jgi:hypothetical protein
MKNANMAVPPSTYRWGRSIGVTVSLFALAGGLIAQELPPIPGGGDPGGTPREPTPEELEEQRKAQEARWQKNAEQFQEWLVPQLVFDGHPVQSLAEVDEIQRARLLSLGEENKVENEASFRAAQEWATAHNRPTSFQTERGERFKLIGFENGRPEYHKFLGLHEATVVGASKLWPGGGLGLSLSGSGTVVGLWDQDDVLLTHTELNGRVIDKDGTTVTSHHATAVAGTLASTGVSSNHKGVSYQATVHAYDSFGDTGEMPSAAANDGVRVSNHSYSLAAGWQGNGSGQNWFWWGNTTVALYEDYKFGFYGPEAHGIDSIVYNAPYYLPVWAAGNETGRIAPNGGSNGHYHQQDGFSTLHFDVHNANGPDGYDTILRHGTAKNVLTVGAVSLPSGGYSGPSSVTLWADSSTGPADQRIKPDLVAPGVNVPSILASGGYGSGSSGTSDAAPVITGLLNLLNQRHVQLHGTNRPLLNSTLKALLIHTADECGPNAGPDYKFGWGLPNAERAVDLIDANVTTGTSTDYVAKLHIKEVVLSSGSSIVFSVHSTSAEALKVTLVWTDPSIYPQLTPALNPTDSVLANDLDLRLSGPSGTHYPWSLNPNPGQRGNAATRSGDNAVDNVEQVQIDNPGNNYYLVQITHKNPLANGMQRVSIILSGVVPLPTAQEMKITSMAQTGASQMTLLFPSVVGQSYQVQYIDTVTASSWTNAGSEVVAVAANTAVNVAFSTSNPQRFYRVITVD